MRITVLGATGRIGTQLVRQAVTAGHQVVAPVRDTARAPAGCEAVAVDIFDPEALLGAMDGSEAVLSALGPRGGGPTSVLTDGARSALTVMTKLMIRRYVVVSAAGAFVEPADGPVTRYVAKPLLGWVLREGFIDVRRMEGVVRDSALDWTIVRPPRLLDRPLTGKYRTALDEGLRGGRSIGRADVAHAMLAALSDPATVRHTLGVAY